MQMTALLLKILLFTVLIFLGWIGARKKVLTGEFNRGTSWLLMNVFLVATIANSIISTDAARYSAAELGRLLLLVTLLMVMLFALSALAVHLLRVEKDKAARLELLMALPNSMFFSLPIVETLYGSEAVFIVALCCIPFNALAFSYGIVRLGGRGRALRLRSIFSAPLVATLAATLVFILRIPVPNAVKSLLSGVAGGTVPISMLLVGASLGGVNISKALRDRTMYLLTAMRFVILPLAVWLLFGLFVRDTVTLNTLVIIAASPSAVVVTAMSVQYTGSGEYTSEGIFLTTLLSMLTIPLTVMLIM